MQISLHQKGCRETHAVCQFHKYLIRRFHRRRRWILRFRMDGYQHTKQDNVVGEVHCICGAVLWCIRTVVVQKDKKYTDMKMNIAPQIGIASGTTAPQFMTRRFLCVIFVRDFLPSRIVVQLCCLRRIVVQLCCLRRFVLQLGSCLFNFGE